VAGGRLHLIPRHGWQAVTRGTKGMKAGALDWVEQPVSEQFLESGGGDRRVVRMRPFAESALGKREGVYTPIAMERVRKRLKIRGLRRSIVHKSPEAIESKGDT